MSHDEIAVSFDVYVDLRHALTQAYMKGEDTITVQDHVLDRKYAEYMVEYIDNERPEWRERYDYSLANHVVH